MSSYFLLHVFGLSVLFCSIAVLIERLLMVYGCTRGRTTVLVVLVFTGNVLGQILGYKIPFYIYELGILFVGIVAANRFEFIATATKGRWWWKKENNIKES